VSKPTRSADVLDAGGAAAPPRRNGELVFTAPWESRLFGLTMSLHQAGRFEWEEFRQILIAEIGAWDERHGADAEYSYWERWRAALEKLLASRGLCSASELEARLTTFAGRPPGHDH
jgi:nitrile hydratase accessory protein